MEEAIAASLAVNFTTPLVSQPYAEATGKPAGSVEVVALTPREREVLAMLGQRFTNAEIADHLFLSHRTVEDHVTRILGKLGAANRREAAAKATRLGLIARENVPSPR
jgi:DNA-binding NarL/FixJ family response regulator